MHIILNTAKMFVYYFLLLSVIMIFLTPNNKIYSQSIHRYHKNIPIEARKAVNYHSKRYNIPVKLLYALIRIESAGKKYAVSCVGAKGYMQLMPFTYIQMGYNPKVQSVYNAYYNIGAGAKYLRYLINLFKGNLKMAIACYNCGPWKIYKKNSKKRIRLKTWRNVPSVSKKYYADIWRIYKKTSNNFAQDKKFIQTNRTIRSKRKLRHKTKIVQNKPDLSQKTNVVQIKPGLSQKTNTVENKPPIQLKIEDIIDVDEQRLIKQLNERQQDDGSWHEDLFLD